METIADGLVLFHICTAIVTTLMGLGTVFSKKAMYDHKTLGKVYYYGMLVTIVSAFIIICFPEHMNIHMLLVGFFSLYFTLMGFRAISFKNLEITKSVKRADRLMVVGLGVISIFMSIYGVWTWVSGDNWGIILLVYSLFGYVNVWYDHKYLSSDFSRPYEWVKIHSTKMIASFIGAVTAVMVTQLSDLLGLWAWFIPSVLGIGYMWHWVIKIDRDPVSIFVE